MIKSTIIKYISRNFYPQNVFANAIIKELGMFDMEKLLIDAPCGNGETSWHFSKVKNLNILAIDNDGQSMKQARYNFNSAKIKFIIGDIIEETRKLEKIDFYCIINSLFLLSEVEELMFNIRLKLNSNGKLFVIVPNVYGKNYNWFDSRNLNFNKLALKKEEFSEFFKKFNYKVKSVTPIAFAHHYGRFDTKFLSILSHFYLSLLNYFQTKLRIGSPNYYLIVCE